MARKPKLTDPSEANPTQGVPQTKSEAIRWALKELGDVDASSAEVRAMILERWPKSQVKQEVEADKNWSQIVSMNRKRAAEEFGLQSGNAAAKTPITSDELRLIKSMVSLCGGDTKRLRELLVMREKLGPLGRVFDILTEWEELTGQSTQEGL